MHNLSITTAVSLSLGLIAAASFAAPAWSAQNHNSSTSNRGCGAGTPSNSECARLSTDIDHYERNVRISRVGWGAFGVASAAGLLYLTWPLFSGTSPAANVTATVAFQRLEISGRF